MSTESILLILCGIFYAVLCVFSIVTGLMYASGRKDINPLELSDKFMSRYADPEKRRRFAIKMGWVTFAVGIVQGITAFSMTRADHPVFYGIALGFTIFSIASVAVKLRGKINAFPILKCIAYVVILAVLIWLPLAADQDGESDMFWKNGSIEKENGGTTRKVNKKAPKKIESKEITQFSCTVCLYGDWGEDYRLQREFRFRIEEDEDGELMAAETESGVEFPADEELLTSLQELIDNYQLVLDNGLYEVTNALPPPYQEITFSAEYASGEKLTFTVNNSPDREWEKALYQLFDDWFRKNGREL